MWGFIAQVGIWAGLYVANYLLRPKEEKPKPLTRDNLTLPRTEEGSPIPLVFGRVRVTSPVLAWHGDLQSKVNTISGSHSIMYACNMLFIVGMPMGVVSDSVFGNRPVLYGVWVGDKKLPMKYGGLPARNFGDTVRAQTVHRKDFFGGLGAGGGLFGAFEWFWGGPNQDLCSPQTQIGDLLKADINPLYGLASSDTTMIPMYRNMMIVAFHDDDPDGFYGSGRYATDGADETGTHPPAWTIGETPSIDGFSFEVGTYGTPDPTVSAMTDIGYDYGGDADPAHVIFDILTGKFSKIGLDESAIDKASFLTASTTLKAEGHGYSNAHYDRDEGSAILAEVLQQIDAALYEEPTTGKLTLKLIRADYDPNTLPVFSSASGNIIEVDDYGIGAWKDSINEVRVNYTDRNLDYKTSTAVAQSHANAVTNANRRRTRTFDYPGISNGRIAAAVAARELNVLSRPLKKIALVLNRDAYALRPGSCFKVTYPEYNLNSVIFRCGKVDVGQLFDNKVIVEAVEDAFASTYVGMPVFGEFVPFPTPYPLVDQVVTEVPYWLALAAKNIGVINDQTVPRLIAVASPSVNAVRYSVVSREQPSITDGSATSRLTANPGADQLAGSYSSDVPAVELLTTFTVKTAYSRNLDPYDTTTGIEVENFEDPLRTFAEIEDALTLADASVTAISTQGANLILIITPDGEHEFMAFERCTSLAGDVLRFELVWRGLMDTPAIDIPVGSRGYFISAHVVGRRGYAKGRTVNYRVIPHSHFVGGSGEDPFGSIAVTGRPWRPVPLADVRLAGEKLAGTTGLPAVTGHYKTVSRMEESVDIYGRTRLRVSSLLERGDGSDQASTDFSATSYAPFAYTLITNQSATNRESHNSGRGMAETHLDALNPITGAPITGVLIDGFGTVYLEARSSRTIAAGDPAIGQAGIALGDVLTSWSHPKVQIAAPEWRNLMGNPRFTYAGGLTPWWTASNVSVSTGSSSITRKTTGKYAAAPRRAERSRRPSRSTTGRGRLRSRRPAELARAVSPWRSGATSATSAATRTTRSRSASTRSTPRSLARELDRWSDASDRRPDLPSTRRGDVHPVEHGKDQVGGDLHRGRRGRRNRERGLGLGDGASRSGRCTTRARRRRSTSWRTAASRPGDRARMDERNELLRGRRHEREPERSLRARRSVRDQLHLPGVHAARGLRVRSLRGRPRVADADDQQ